MVHGVVCKPISVLSLDQAEQLSIALSLISFFLSCTIFFLELEPEIFGSNLFIGAGARAFWLLFILGEPRAAAPVYFWYQSWSLMFFGAEHPFENNCLVKQRRLYFPVSA